MRLCAECGDKPALFKIRNQGKVKADKRHDLCFRCFRATTNRLRVYACSAQEQKDKS